MSIRTLNPEARQAVSTILTRTGHALTLDDIPAIIEIQAISERISAPGSITRDDVALPYILGNVMLYPPCLGAIRWYEEYAERWFSSTPMWADIMLAWIMSIRDPRDELWSIITRRQARKIVKAWWKDLSCTYEELLEATKAILPKDDDSYIELPKRIDHVWLTEAVERIAEKVEEPSVCLGLIMEAAEAANSGDGNLGDGSFIAFLMREFGKDEDYWYWHASGDHINSCVRDFNRRCEENAESQRKAAVNAGQPAPIVSTQKTTDLIARRNMVNRLRVKWETT